MPFLLALSCFLLLATPPAPAQNRVLALGERGGHVRLPSHIFNHLEEATLENILKILGEIRHE